MKRNKNLILTLLFVIQVIGEVLFLNDKVVAQQLEWIPKQLSGDWSRDAISLNESNADDSSEYIIMPRTRSKIIKVLKKGRTIQVIAKERILKTSDELGVDALCELLWSKKLNAFVLTQSEGGWVGSWYASIYLMDADSVRVIDISSNVIKSFMKHYSCPEGTEEPNIGALKWLNNDKELLLIAEVPPHSSCPDMGMIMGYIVEISTGRIIKEYDQDSLKKQWGKNLGRRLQSR
jgi:hypothetical protein